MDADKSVVDARTDAQHHLDTAYAELDAERYETALRECQAAIDLAPEWAEAHNVHGLILDELDRLREAAEAYHTALKLDPDHANARDNLLGVLTEMMAGDLTAAADLDDEDPDDLALQHLEWAYELLDEEDEEEDLELALWESDLAISLSPDLADAHNLRGILLEALGDRPGAIDAFHTAVELDPDFAEARENLTELEAEEGGRQVPPPTPDIPAGELLVAGDRPVPATGPDIIEAGDPGQPTETQSRLDLAYEHNERGEFTDALRECDAILEVAPGLAEAHNLRGIVLEALGRPDEAVDAYRSAIHLAPDFGDARENLHELLGEMGESDPIVTVTTFTNPLEAQGARMTLDEHGIWSLVLDDSLLITGVRLLARQSDLEDIIDILELASDEGLQCPECGSWQVDVPLVGSKRRCETCGHEWRV